MKKRISIIVGVLCFCIIIITVWSTRNDNNKNTVADQKKKTSVQEVQQTPTEKTPKSLLFLL